MKSLKRNDFTKLRSSHDIILCYRIENINLYIQYDPEFSTSTIKNIHMSREKLTKIQENINSDYL